MTNFKNIRVVAYNKEATVQEILEKMTQEEIESVFSSILEIMLQEGKWGEEQNDKKH